MLWEFIISGTAVKGDDDDCFRDSGHYNVETGELLQQKDSELGEDSEMPPTVGKQSSDEADKMFKTEWEQGHPCVASNDRLLAEQARRHQ
jgi:hypothetical protein